MRHPCLIYQCWNGPLTTEAAMSSELMAQYADHIGVEYHLDVDRRWAGKRCRYFDMFRPVVEREFDRFARICTVDLDVFPVDGLDEDIFDEDVGDLGMVEEIDQPAFRSIPVVSHITTKNDDEWASRFGAATFPRDHKGRLRVFNSGVVLFSRPGIERLREGMWAFEDYENATAGLPTFYQWDQHYLHAMTFVLGLRFSILPPRWNVQVFHLPEGIYDPRDDQTCFVHVQLRGAAGFSRERMHEVVNG